MLQSSKLLQSPPQPSHCQLQTSKSIRSQLPASQSDPKPLPSLRQSRLPRRELAIRSSSVLLLLAADPFQLTAAKAEEEANTTASNEVGNQETVDNNLAQEEGKTPISNEVDKQEIADDKLTGICDKVTKRAFMDISVDGQPQGRVVIGLYEKSVPTGAARFNNLVTGSAGVSYRRKEFTKIMPNYIQHGGVRSYGVDAEMARKTGRELGSETLTEEWARQNASSLGTKTLAGSVGIIVRNPMKPPPKLKLVAKKGKFVIDEEEVGTDPNGTEFVIVTKDSPELDASVLVVGEVLEGMDVVQKIGQVKTVQENTSSPYFRVAKLIGDKRAVVAERGFNRPYSKVVVTNCNVIK